MVMKTIDGKEFYVTSGQKVMKIKNRVWNEEDSFLSNHEEVDTRMTLHAKHASLYYRKVLISSPDTDVFVILLSVSHEIDASLFFLTGVQNTRRIIAISAVSEYIASNLNPAGAEKEILCSLYLEFTVSLDVIRLVLLLERGKSNHLT